MALVELIPFKIQYKCLIDKYKFIISKAKDYLETKDAKSILMIEQHLKLTCYLQKEVEKVKSLGIESYNKDLVFKDMAADVEDTLKKLNDCKMELLKDVNNQKDHFFYKKLDESGVVEKLQKHLFKAHTVL